MVTSSGKLEYAPRTCGQRVLIWNRGVGVVSIRMQVNSWERMELQAGAVGKAEGSHVKRYTSLLLSHEDLVVILSESLDPGPGI